MALGHGDRDGRRGGRVRAGRRPRWVVAAAYASAGVLALVGCQSQTGTSSRDAASQPARAEASPSPSPAPVPPRLALVPAEGSTEVPPDAPVTVIAWEGALESVALTGPDGEAVDGQVTADGTRWTSAGALAPGASYSLSARATGEGGTTSASSSFSTVATDALLHTAISPLDGQTVGVGMPLVVRLSEPVQERAAVQQALQVHTDPAVEGSWSWVRDDELQWRPRSYWPSGTEVRLDVGLTGVHAGGEVWGDETRTVAFTIGPATVSTVDVAGKTMTVRRGGEVVRTIPVTTGKDGYRTRGGIKVISEKHREKTMDAATGGVSRDDPEYYRLDVEYALRLTWSGEFVHAAPWSRGSQGLANVSHGCVGMSVEDAAWFYQQSLVGDPVEFVNSTRALEPGNGYTAWNVPWEEWVAASAV